MGWSWALYFCQSVVENALDISATPGDHSYLLRPREPAPTVSRNKAIGAAYVDNAFLRGIPDGADDRQFAFFVTF